MDFLVKLLFLSGKYLTQAAGRTILGIINKGVMISKSISFKYEKAVQVVKPYNNMLELLNTHIQDNMEAESTSVYNELITWDGLITGNNLPVTALPLNNMERILFDEYKFTNLINESSQSARDTQKRKLTLYNKMIFNCKFEPFTFNHEITTASNQKKATTVHPQSGTSKTRSFLVKSNSCMGSSNMMHSPPHFINYNSLDQLALIAQANPQYENKFECEQKILKRKKSRKDIIYSPDLMKKNNEQLELSFLPSKFNTFSHITSASVLQDGSHFSKSDSNLNRKLKQCNDKVDSKRKLSSTTTELADSFSETEREMKFLRLNHRAFYKMERGLHDDKTKGRTKDQKKKTWLNLEEIAERKKLIEVNQKVFDDFEKDLNKIVLLDRNKKMDCKSKSDTFINSFKHSLNAAALNNSIKDRILKVLNKRHYKRDCALSHVFKHEVQDVRNRLLKQAHWLKLCEPKLKPDVKDQDINTKALLAAESVKLPLNDMLQKLLQAPQQCQNRSEQAILETEKSCMNCLKSSGENKCNFGFSRQCFHFKSNEILDCYRKLNEDLKCDGQFKNSSSHNIVMICANVKNTTMLTNNDDNKIKKSISNTIQSEDRDSEEVRKVKVEFLNQETLMREQEEISECIAKEIDNENPIKLTNEDSKNSFNFRERLHNETLACQPVKSKSATNIMSVTKQKNIHDCNNKKVKSEHTQTIEDGPKAKSIPVSVQSKHGSFKENRKEGKFKNEQETMIDINRCKPHLLTKKFAFKPADGANRNNQLKHNNKTQLETFHAEKDIENNMDLDAELKTERIFEFENNVQVEEHYKTNKAHENLEKAENIYGNYNNLKFNVVSDVEVHDELRLNSNELQEKHNEHGHELSEEMNKITDKEVRVENNEHEQKDCDNNNNAGNLNQREFKANKHSECDGVKKKIHWTSPEESLLNQNCYDVNQSENKHDFSIRELAKLIKHALTQQIKSQFAKDKNVENEAKASLQLSDLLKNGEAASINDKKIKKEIDNIIKEYCDTYAENKTLNRQESDNNKKYFKSLVRSKIEDEMKVTEHDNQSSSFDDVHCTTSPKYCFIYVKGKAFNNQEIVENYNLTRPDTKIEEEKCAKNDISISACPKYCYVKDKTLNSQELDENNNIHKKYFENNLMRPPKIDDVDSQANDIQHVAGPKYCYMRTKINDGTENDNRMKTFSTFNDQHFATSDIKERKFNYQSETQANENCREKPKLTLIKSPQKDMNNKEFLLDAKTNLFRSAIAKNNYISPQFNSSEIQGVESSSNKLNSSLIFKQKLTNENLDRIFNTTKRNNFSPKNEPGTALDTFVKFEKNEDIFSNRHHSGRCFQNKIVTTQDEMYPKAFVRNKTYSFGPTVSKKRANKCDEFVSDESTASNRYKKINTVPNKFSFDSLTDSEMLTALAATGNDETESQRESKSKFVSKTVTSEQNSQQGMNDSLHDSHIFPSSSGETANQCFVRRKKNNAQLISELYKRSIRYAIKRNDRSWLAQQQMKDFQRRKKLLIPTSVDGQQNSKQKTHGMIGSIYERFPFLNKHKKISSKRKINVLNKEVIDNIRKHMQGESQIGKYTKPIRKKQSEAFVKDMDSKLNSSKDQRTKQLERKQKHELPENEYVDSDDIYKRYPLLTKSKEAERKVINQDQITVRLLNLNKKCSNTNSKESHNKFAITKEKSKYKCTDQVIKKYKMKKNQANETKQNYHISPSYSIQNARCSGLKQCYTPQLHAQTCTK